MQKNRRAMSVQGRRPKMAKPRREKRGRFAVTLPYTRNYDRICRWSGSPQPIAGRLPHFLSTLPPPSTLIHYRAVLSILPRNHHPVLFPTISTAIQSLSVNFLDLSFFLQHTICFLSIPPPPVSK